MGYKVDNAIIMAAGLSSRFAPLSYELPKALITVKKEVLIERQIRQLHEAGIHEIIVVVGYKKEQFAYLKEKYGVILVENTQYLTRNNHSSIYAVRNYLKNSYICSADNYFVENPFEAEVDHAYYSAIYQEGETKEWCLQVDEQDTICDVCIGGSNAWYMMGHVFWDEQFSNTFLKILEEEYELEETKDKLWESIYIEHIKELNLKIRRYRFEDIFEFDSLDELREFDESYRTCSHSSILQQCCNTLDCKEEELSQFQVLKEKGNEVIGCLFQYQEETYCYYYETKQLIKAL